MTKTPLIEIPPQDLLDRITATEVSWAKENGEARPHIQGIMADGNVAVLPLDMMQAIGREAFEQVVKLVFVGMNVVRYSVVLGTWLAKMHDPADTRPPSERPDRLEGLCIHVVTREGVVGNLLFMKRDDAGAVIDCPPYPFPPGVTPQMDSWLFHLLPPAAEIPEAVRAQARQMMDRFGLKIAVPMADVAGHA